MHNPNYKDLRTWQLAMALTSEVYEIIKQLPKTETFGLSDQLRRSVVSVPSCIAEGYGRNTTKDLLHYLYMSRGSLFEVDTQLEICVNVGFITREEYEKKVLSLIPTLKSLSNLINYHKKRDYQPNDPATQQPNNLKTYQPNSPATQ